MTDSTPPKVAGSPDQIAFNRWVREQLLNSSQRSSGADRRISAAESAASNAANVASNASAGQEILAERVIAPDSENRLARPILDAQYWTSVTAGNVFVWQYESSITPGVTNRSTSRNVSWTASGGFILQPNGDIESAEIDITPILPVPQSAKLYVEAEYFGSSALIPQIWVIWRDANGDPFPPGGTEALPTLAESMSVVDVPKLLGGNYPAKYSVALVRPAGAGIGATISPKVFEAIGSGGLSVSPGGISVEDENGDKTIDINPNLPELDAPTAPILSSSVGSVSVRWDGDLTSGPAPAHLSYVFAEEATSDSGPWTRVGQPLNRTGDVITRPPVGATRWYRFTAMDTSNRPSATGASASITVEGVSIPDLDGDIGDIIDTVDGLNKIFYEPITNTPPPVDPTTGRALVNADLWFVVDPNTSTVVEVRIWNGTLWNPYRLVADSVIVPGSVGTITLGDGVITSPKIKARELEGDRLKAGTISVDELTPNIGSSLDITINPSVQDLQGNMEQQQRYYRFDDEGLKIGDPATNEELRLTPGRIEMIQAGNSPTWWEAQNFYVQRMIVDAANIGEHRWEVYGDGHSIIRPLRGTS